MLIVLKKLWLDICSHFLSKIVELTKIFNYGGYIFYRCEVGVIPALVLIDLGDHCPVKMLCQNYSHLSVDLRRS